jgi:hypothetical protein
MAPLYVHTDPLEVWALEALLKAGFEVERVHRVYQPAHPDDGDVSEVLYERRGKACTALVEPTGRVILTLGGW